MLRLLAPLVGFAVFAALFAGIYYLPTDAERSIGEPKFRLGPGDAKPDFIDPVAFGENVTVNITVLRGGPVDVYVMDIENITLYVLNGTRYGFDTLPGDAFYNKTVSRLNVTGTYNFTFITDGINQVAVVLVSTVPPHPDPDNLSAQEAEALVTEVDVQMRYLEREKRSLVLGYLLAVPSVALVGITLWLRIKRPLDQEPSAPPQWPRDRGL